MRKHFTLISALAISAALLAACGSSASAANSDETRATETAAVTMSAAAESKETSEATIAISLSDQGSNCDDSSVQISGNTITITKEGSYLFSGTLSDGQIVVQADDTAKVKLILDNASINKNGSAAIYAVSADKLILSSTEGSTNGISASGAFAQTDSDEIDAAVYALCDLNLNGAGTVNINCESGHAVVTRDDLKVKDGTWNLNAGSKGLYGNDSVCIEGGVLNISAGTDGIYADKEDDAEQGGITMLDGTVTIEAGKDGLDATGTIDIQGGSLSVSSGSQASAEDSGKGIKSNTLIQISGGSVTVNAQDDAIHANDTVTISGGELTLSSGDDGVHADAVLNISDGSICVSKSYEGLEANEIIISGGSIDLVASDDGINAAGGNDNSNNFGPFGGDPFSSDSGSTLTISGGLLTIDAGGDGLDANGELIVSGGTIYVNGPTNNGNGALDYGTGASISGGTVIAVGSSGMAENFGTESSQGSILLNLSSAQAAGTMVSIADESGKILASFRPTKSYQSVLISTEGLVQGGSYTVTAGNVSETITLDSLIYGSGSGMGGPGGMGGQMGGPGGHMDGSGFNGQMKESGQMGGPGDMGGFGARR